MSVRLADLPPAQHRVGDRCDPGAGGCGKPLSRYNPYVVCGACRVRMSHEEDEGAAQYIGFTWERLPTREVVRRGPLGVEG